MIDLKNNCVYLTTHYTSTDSNIRKLPITPGLLYLPPIAWWLEFKEVLAAAVSQKLWEPEQGWANHEIVMILSPFNQTPILFIMTSIRNHKNSFILVCKSIIVSLNK